jgi:tRNA-splicing ligase RtcB
MHIMVTACRFGGVLATNNAVIPYGVGVDIGCRMCMTVYDLPVERLGDQRDKFVKLLGDNSRFGQGEFDRPFDDPIFERTEFKEIQVAKQLKNRAAKQIGTSGGGNHFVEFGVVDIRDRNNVLGLEIGRYVGVLSHSGSRGLGANIARHYTKMAMEACKLPKVAKHLAWLDLDSELGQEYWLAMNLAGDYASACHHHIHRRMADSLGLKPLTMVENHHNFAWKEQLADGTEVVVHRKGATPAQKGVLGIIPGSMTAPGFIVSGKGQPGALQSASHGAGRQMSRTVAKNSTTRNALNKLLQEEGVTLLGGGLDESPIAYKDIHQVMRSQTDLVDIVGLFYPKIVRMAD